MIGKDLDEKIPLWNEGARRLYGYEPEEVVGKVKSSILHTPEDVQAGKPQEMIAGTRTPFRRYFTDPERAEESVKLLREGKVTLSRKRCCPKSKPARARITALE